MFDCTLFSICFYYVNKSLVNSKAVKVAAAAGIALKSVGDSPLK